MTKAEAPKQSVVNEGSHRERTKLEHDAYGMVGVTRVMSSGKVTLHGSSLGHSTYIQIEVSRGSTERDLGRDWHREDGQVVTFAVSEAQWARIVSSIGIGAGTPCTLQRAPERGTYPQQMPEILAEPVRKTFENDFANTAKEIAEEVIAVQKMMQDILDGGKAPTKTQLKEMQSMLTRAGEHFPSNMTFLHKQFDAAMEETVEDAKGSIEAFYLTVATNTGIKAIAEGMQPVMLEDKSGE